MRVYRAVYDQASDPGNQAWVWFGSRREAAQFLRKQQLEGEVAEDTDPSIDAIDIETGKAALLRALNRYAPDGNG